MIRPFLVALMLAFAAVAAEAKSPAGFVVDIAAPDDVDPVGTIERDGKALPLAIGSTLFAGDVVRLEKRVEAVDLETSAAPKLRLRPADTPYKIEGELAIGDGVGGTVGRVIDMIKAPDGERGGKVTTAARGDETPQLPGKPAVAQVLARGETVAIAFAGGKGPYFVEALGPQKSLGSVKTQAAPALLPIAADAPKSFAIVVTGADSRLDRRLVRLVERLPAPPAAMLDGLPSAEMRAVAAAIWLADQGDAYQLAAAGQLAALAGRYPPARRALAALVEETR
ncbi:MAG: hypothetical protein JNM13_17370 [Hyphomicrobiaceae bacterium]|nr:hypothetical protein [Hyphomicrobiaceae bacterium]